MIIKIGNKPYELATKEEVMKEVIKQMEETKKEIFDKLYPVGSVYISLDATFNPNNIYNGKWKLLEKGRYLRATDNISRVGQKVDASAPGLDKLIYKLHDNINGPWAAPDIVLGKSTGINEVIMSNAMRTGKTGIVYSIDYSLCKNYSVYKEDATTITTDSIDAFIWKRVE